MDARPAHCSTGAIASLRRGRRRAVAWLALCTYVMVAAIVPPGHMAAAVDAGTPFHLCPGDLRSAQILRAFSPAAVPAPSPSPSPSAEAGHAPGAHHAHGPAGHAKKDVASDDTAGHGHHGRLADAFDNDAADAGCIVAGGLALGTAEVASDLESLATFADRVTPLRSATPRGARWLRPPTRSPPA